MRLFAPPLVLLILACGGGPGDATVQLDAPAPTTGAAPAPPAAPVGGTDDGLVDAAANFNGGREVDEEGQADVNHAVALIDRVPESDFVCGKEQRCDVVLELAEAFDLEKLVVRGPTDPAIAVRELAVEVGPGHAGPWTEVTKVQLATGKAPQAFPLAAKGARYVRLRPLSTHVAESEYYGLDDVELRGRRAPRTVSWTGTWIHDANWEIELKQEGDRVTGCYGYDDRIEGTVDGPVFTGVYHDIDGETVTNGRIVLVLTPERALRGVRSESMDAGAPLPLRFDGAWHGEPVKLHCAPPVEEAPDAIEQALAKDGRVALYGVLFDFDKDTLKPESGKVLDALAKTIAARPDRTYRIEGHTDDRGGDAYNRDLSERRAKAVARWLAEHGCPEDKLVTEGFGASAPVLPNDTAAGRAQNRRVEVAIVLG